MSQALKGQQERPVQLGSLMTEESQKRPTTSQHVSEHKSLELDIVSITPETVTVARTTCAQEPPKLQGSRLTESEQARPVRLQGPRQGHVGEEAAELIAYEPLDTVLIKTVCAQEHPSLYGEVLEAPEIPQPAHVRKQATLCSIPPEVATIEPLPTVHACQLQRDYPRLYGNSLTEPSAERPVPEETVAEPELVEEQPPTALELDALKALYVARKGRRADK